MAVRFVTVLALGEMGAFALSSALFRTSESGGFAVHRFQGPHLARGTGAISTEFFTAISNGDYAYFVFCVYDGICFVLVTVRASGYGLRERRKFHNYFFFSCCCVEANELTGFLTRAKASR